jgi:hypothetical protein
MDYQPYTRYDGFLTGPVYKGSDGADDIVYVDNGDHYTVIWVNGTDSGFLRNVDK